MFFITVVVWLLLQRLLELRAAKRNTVQLINDGGIEFGSGHYYMIVVMHVLFFVSLPMEYAMRRPELPNYWPFAFAAFILAQLLRYWVRRSLRHRWTTRIIVVPGEVFVSRGPYRLFPHPNYFAVALEILSVPLIFGLYWTAILFTIFNSIVLLLIRIPAEANAIAWSKSQQARR